jgi:hypothetical protein
MPLGRSVIGQKVKAGQIPSRCHTVLPRLPPTTNFSPAEQLQLISENFDSNVRILKALQFPKIQNLSNCRAERYTTANKRP